MDNKKTITIIILGLVAMAGILLFLFLPSKSHLANIDFYVYDTNDNFHYEVNERLELLVNDTAAIKGKRLIWEMGNGFFPVEPCRIWSFHVMKMLYITPIFY